MISHISQDVDFGAFFTKNKVGVVPANAPTVDVGRKGQNALIVTAGSAVAKTNMAGMYTFTLVAANDGIADSYYAIFKTADTTVDQQELPAMLVIGNTVVSALPPVVPDGTGGLATCDVTGSIKANLWQILSTTLTETVTGYLAAAFKKLFDVVTPVMTAASVNQSADSNTILAHGTYGNAQLARTSATATIANQTTILNAVNAITTNTARSAPRVLDFMARPNAGSVAYTGDLYLYNLQGQLEDADGNTVTVHARNSIGSSLDAGLTSTTMTRISVGFYRMTYTVASTDTAQAVYFDFSWAINAVAMRDGGATEVQDAENYAYLVAIRAKTDLIGTNAADSPNTVTAQSNVTGIVTSVSTIITGVTTLTTNLAVLAAKFTGITVVANWLRAAIRKSTPDATALTEINTGGGTYAASSSSQQAISDLGGGGSISYTVEGNSYSTEDKG